MALVQRCIGLRPVGRINKSSPVERAVSSSLAGHAMNPFLRLNGGIHAANGAASVGEHHASQFAGCLLKNEDFASHGLLVTSSEAISSSAANAQITSSRSDRCTHPPQRQLASPSAAGAFIR
ncbi:hypothetical protein XAC3810_770127 [Xanthomonas citri pv. citri]|uniref:Uncharacterized protein n=1 Tax=Xanthomonas citri pv. citri TaxID=611301 RepID=A0A0U5FRE4_XANCI|nr:hypothetical protein XAC902_1070125 [Xanthomonas citri pv. citri]CEE23069.1 hypothetical protein XAC908_1090086 [Xanthomonas citri pv. citri]CEE40187.1 hypothetical protein XAC3824_920128 [Xanthomonas citri pv. citri]CEE40262.1 hypothetical protein XAC9322_740128 [Xanthomonas citri pv. citri]CEE41733.1 hypothetical protein XAC1083_770109 [Xanthomonas citri pv. citri]